MSGAANSARSRRRRRSHATTLTAPAPMTSSSQSRPGERKLTPSVLTGPAPTRRRFRPARAGRRSTRRPRTTSRDPRPRCGSRAGRRGSGRSPPSSTALDARKYWPCVDFAILRSSSRRTGTLNSRPSARTVPSAVPKAIVDTGTLAASAAAAPTSDGRPDVVSPSERITTCAPLIVPSSRAAASRSAGRCRRATSDCSIASPIAVPGPGCAAWSARIAWPWLVVGSTGTDATCEKITTPTRIRAGSAATKLVAASRAATRRDGLTSVASIDFDTSSATMTAPSSRATSTSCTGRANATTSAPSITRKSAAVA